MFQTFFHRRTVKPRCTTRLVVETLEGRDVPSTLPVLVESTPLAAWHPPTVAGHGSLDPAGAIVFRSIGEEIPQSVAVRGSLDPAGAVASLFAGNAHPAAYKVYFHQPEEIPQ
jgi:hypothetical protein